MDIAYCRSNCMCGQQGLNWQTIGEIFRIHPSREVGFAGLPSHEEVSSDCHYHQTQPTRQNVEEFGTVFFRICPFLFFFHAQNGSRSPCCILSKRARCFFSMLQPSATAVLHPTASVPKAAQLARLRRAPRQRLRLAFAAPAAAAPMAAKTAAPPTTTAMDYGTAATPPRPAMEHSSSSAGRSRRVSSNELRGEGWRQGWPLVERRGSAWGESDHHGVALPARRSLSLGEEACAHYPFPSLRSVV